MNAAALLVMPCSSTKSRAAGLVPALNRYDGPIWRTLRRALEDADTGRGLDIWFLSARLGFHPATMPIADYDQRMTDQRAAELLRLPTSNRAAFSLAVAAAPVVLFAGGRLYRETMKRAAIGTTNRPGVTETDGPGLGYQRAQLRAWLQGLAS